jgi:valyl-tRNA synthetase
MKRFHARVAVVKALKDAGLYIETKDNPMQIPICRLVFVSFVSFWADQTK